MSTLKKTLRDSRWARWLALACLVVPMFASYFFDDMFLCIWGGLIICGALLDKFGVRLVGSIFVGMMAGGAALVTFAISAGFAPEKSLTIAYIGCMLFGLGSEIAGVSVTRSIAKWFKGKNMALAMGLQLAIARFGTATAILIAPMIVTQKASGEIYTLADTNKPALIGLAVIAIGVLLWAVFVAMDARFDRQTALPDDSRALRDILLLRDPFQEIRCIDPASSFRGQSRHRDSTPGNDSVLHHPFHSALRSTGGQGRKGNHLDDSGFRNGTHLAPYHNICSAGSAGICICCNCPSGNRLFTCAVGYVAFGA